MSVQTRYNEIMVKRGMQNMGKFGAIDMTFGIRCKWGTDIKGWLDECERLFRVNNVPDEHKVSLISNQLFDIPLIWHEKFVSIMGENMTWMIYKDAILRRFDTVQKTQSPCNSTKNSCFIWYNDDDEDFVAHKMFDEMPIKKISKEGVKEASDVVENNFGNMVLDDVSKECHNVEEFEFKCSSEVDNGCFVGLDNFVGKVDKNIGISSLDPTSFDLVETVKKLVEVENVVAIDKNMKGNIRSSDVLRSGDLELTKRRSEQLTGYGINNMKEQVGVGDLREYEDRLLRFKDALLLWLHGSLICLDISSFDHEYVHKAKAKGEFILKSKKVFDPGGLQVSDIWGFDVGNVFNKHNMDTRFKLELVTAVKSYAVENLWLKSKEYEFEVIRSLDDNVLIICVIEGIDFRGGQSGNDVIMNREVVAIIVVEINQKVVSSVTIVLEVTKFGMAKDNVFEKFLGSGFVVELLIIRNMCDKPSESVRRSCESCYSQWGYIVVIEVVWNGDCWPMKDGANCIVVEGVQGVSQFNHHPDSTQSMVEEVGPEVDTEVPKLVDNELVPELVFDPVGTKVNTNERTAEGCGSQSHTEVDIELAGYIFISGNSFKSLYANSSKQRADGNEPDVIDTCMGFTDVYFGVDFYDPPQLLCVKDSQASTQFELHYSKCNNGPEFDPLSDLDRFFHLSAKSKGIGVPLLLHGLLEDAPQLVPPVTNWPVIGCICWGGGVDDEAVMDLVGVAGIAEELGTLMEGDTLTMVAEG
ncbi:hypothetical protein CTI12_AA197690 [Artemisia annua]|uniref:Uncharacterized protein n=1 Tax=Artemisia annua TaxID=35608 RepID=A0A2U1P3J2_ARTAN|nr:hypothetical protein CTI12_AA197690 [Artemisia annua]